jgi:hypothetical protein
MDTGTPTRTPRRRRFDEISSPPSRRSPRQRVRRIRDDAADVLPLVERTQQFNTDIEPNDLNHPSLSDSNSDVSVEGTYWTHISLPSLC